MYSIISVIIITYRYVRRPLIKWTDHNTEQITNNKHFRNLLVLFVSDSASGRNHMSSQIVKATENKGLYGWHMFQEIIAFLYQCIDNLILFKITLISNVKKLIFRALEREK